VELNPRFRFESFVVGASNRLAAAAAQSVAASPGSVYNPLVVYARSGLGKTHLLHAIGHAAIAAQPALSARYLTLEEFVEQYHAAVAAGQVEPFRKSAAETDLLLLDDAQFLAKHREMQAELLRISEALLATGRQLVLTSDRPPGEIENLDERLITRFSGGLLVDISAPDYETRLVILRRKAEERGAVFQPGVLEIVAQIAAVNVRELIGLVNRLIAFQAVSDAPLTADGARALLVDELRPEERAAGAAAPTQPAAAPQADEFSAFLSAVTRTVAQSLEAWKSRVGEAVMRWQGEGYRTARLEELLKSEAVPDVDAELSRYETDIEELRRLAAEAGELDPAAAGHARFRDPDQLAEARDFVRTLREGMSPLPAPSAAFTFDSLIVGGANDAAVRAARLVAKEPGRRYNPFYITGPSGVGKTHLLHAIGNALHTAESEAVVACLSAQEFVEEILAAIANDRLEWWRRRYRRADAFLLDDVHLLAGKEGSQEELFNLFNVLGDAERQMAFTADRPPAQLPDVAHRLITRFEGGLVVELSPPDRAMRAVLVRRLLDSQGISAEDDVVQYVASRPADSARAVQGLVNKALAGLESGEETLSLSLARMTIEGRTSRPSQAQAISTLIPTRIDAVLSSREKIVWDWPDAGERLIEELR
jgi:chromosomal replication initiator protein DnaA